MTKNSVLRWREKVSNFVSCCIFRNEKTNFDGQSSTTRGPQAMSSHTNTTAAAAECTDLRSHCAAAKVGHVLCRQRRRCESGRHLNVPARDLDKSARISIRNEISCLLMSQVPYCTDYTYDDPTQKHSER